MKKAFFIIMIGIMVLLAACTGNLTGQVSSTTGSPASSNPALTTPTTSGTLSPFTPPVSVSYDEDDVDAGTGGSGVSYIKLNGNTVSYDGTGAIIEKSTVTITSAGSYNISGTLDDGQIVVNARVSGTVRLIFDGADIFCSTSAPIYVMNAEKVVITLAEGKQNTVTDGASYTYEYGTDNEPGAAIYAKCDLTINGSGSLTVTANCNNGIQSQDDLKITGGNIAVKAVNEGLQGKDSVAIKDGDVNINAGGDGIQSTNESDSGKGYVSIQGGTIDIIAGSDAIQAATSVAVSGGNLTLKSGGGSVNSSSGANWGNWGRLPVGNTAQTDTSSAKGIKAAIDITIAGGIINIDSSDDSIHSNNSINIEGGVITMSSGDDGMHADATLVINGGDITITKSYEGIESASITVNAGNTHLVSSDDGFNAAGGADGSAVNGRPGQNNFLTTGSNTLVINGGYIYVNSEGDGLDVNGPLVIAGGTVIVDGPTRNDNGALDYTGSFKMTGGFIIAAGSSGMAQAPSSTSTQYSMMVNLSAALPAGTLFHVETSEGENVLTFKPTRSFQSVVLCSSDLKQGKTYSIYTGGTSTGTVVDGIYSGETYSGGILVTTMTLSGMVTTYGTSGGMGGGMRR